MVAPRQICKGRNTDGRACSNDFLFFIIRFCFFLKNKYRGASYMYLGIFNIQTNNINRRFVLVPLFLLEQIFLSEEDVFGIVKQLDI